MVRGLRLEDLESVEASGLDGFGTRWRRLGPFAEDVFLDACRLSLASPVL